MLNFCICEPLPMFCGEKFIQNFCCAGCFSILITADFACWRCPAIRTAGKRGLNDEDNPALACGGCCRAFLDCGTGDGIMTMDDGRVV